jgi:hypothetical protein
MVTLAISNSKLWDRVEGSSHWKQFTYCYKYMYMYHSGYAFNFVRIPKDQRSQGIVKAIKCRYCSVVICKCAWLVRNMDENNSSSQFVKKLIIGFG